MTGDFLESLGDGITRIDTGYERPGSTACYLIAHEGVGALVDTGTALSLPRILVALEAAGLGAGDVRYVMPTHVHLDHAGGAGVLMRECPNAELVVHPRGARHLVDPTKLIDGVKAVYGADGFEARFGELPPVPAERVVEAPDGFTVDLAGRTLMCMDTPGHARHHYCVWDAASRSLFTGDTFGLHYDELAGPRGRVLLATTTPVQFDPDAWERTIDHMLALSPSRMLLTHFGAVDDIPAAANQLRASVREHAEIARKLVDAVPRMERIRDALLETWTAQLRDIGCTLDAAQIKQVLAMDAGLNAQGLDFWLAHQ
ncbi:MAG: MBL fold metallo-hydrolase [Chromatiales bacterium]|nr:MBL fold metallo-hydrolase [Chromatiales bacterium]